MNPKDKNPESPTFAPSSMTNQPAGYLPSFISAKFPRWFRFVPPIIIAFSIYCVVALDFRYSPCAWWLHSSYSFVRDCQIRKSLGESIGQSWPHALQYAGLVTMGILALLFILFILYKSKIKRFIFNYVSSHINDSQDPTK